MSADHEQRLQKLEENQAFGERALDELSEEFRVLSQKVAELAAMLTRVEALLAEGDEEEPTE